MADEMGIRELRDSLSETIARVEGGEVVTVTRHGRPVAVVVPAGVPAGLAALVAEGRLEWRGRPLTAPAQPPPLRGPGPLASDYVRAGRR
jgi:prevent-host-death family protein